MHGGQCSLRIAVKVQVQSVPSPTLWLPWSRNSNTAVMPSETFCVMISTMCYSVAPFPSWNWALTGSSSSGNPHKDSYDHRSLPAPQPQRINNRKHGQCHQQTPSPLVDPEPEAQARYLFRGVNADSTAV